MLVRLHIGTVVTLTLLSSVLLALDPPGSGGGANIGLGIALLPVMFFGLPWSAAVYPVSDLAGLSGRTPVLSTLYLCSIILTPICNVWSHVYLYRRYRRRRGLSAPL